MNCFLLIFVIYQFALTVPVEGQISYLECEKQTDCLASDAICEDNVCKCPPGTILSIPKKKCLEVSVGFGAPCEDDMQCVNVFGRSICNNGKCDCSEDSHYLKGRCILPKALGESCESNDDCFNGYELYSIICKDKKCQCRDGYYNRNNYDCRPEGKKVDDFCAIDLDCKFDGGYCDVAKCKSRTVLASTIVGKKTSTVDESTNYANLSTYALNKPCKDTADCEVDVNSYCSHLLGKCICKRGYYEKDGGCLPELGTENACGVDGDCGKAKYRCVNGICYCKQLFSYNFKGNRDCQKVALSSKCISTEGCMTYGRNSICVNSQCVCKPLYMLDMNFICSSIYCYNEDDCSHIPNTVCSTETGLCECKENFQSINEICVPKLNGDCSTDEDCKHINNALCTAIGNKKVCMCDLNQYYYPDGDAACKLVAPLDESCSNKEDCVASTDCIDGKCKCTDMFIEIDDSCHEKKSIGSTCVSKTECTLSLGINTECRKSQCSCIEEYEPTDDKLSCKFSNATVNQPLLLITYLLFALYWITYSYN